MCDAVNDNQGRVNNPGTKVLHQQTFSEWSGKCCVCVKLLPE